MISMTCTSNWYIIVIESWSGIKLLKRVADLVSAARHPGVRWGFWGFQGALRTYAAAWNSAVNRRRNEVDALSVKKPPGLCGIRSGDPADGGVPLMTRSVGSSDRARFTQSCTEAQRFCDNDNSTPDWAMG